MDHHWLDNQFGTINETEHTADDQQQKTIHNILVVAVRLAETNAIAFKSKFVQESLRFPTRCTSLEIVSP